MNKNNGAIAGVFVMLIACIFIVGILAVLLKFVNTDTTVEAKTYKTNGRGGSLSILDRLDNEIDNGRYDYLHVGGLSYSINDEDEDEDDEDDED